MTVRELNERLPLTPLCLPEPDRQITGGYAGDLLSWVMGRASADAAWVTIMTNINVVAVASLSDVACVLLAEDVAVDDAVVRTAESRGVNVLRSPLPVYELCCAVHEALKSPT